MADVLGSIRDTPGKLSISRFNEEQSFVLTFHNSSITCLQYNGQDVSNREQALSFITELIQSNQGEFDFNREISAPGYHDLPINEVLNSALSLIDDIQAFREHFPDPDTIFVLSNDIHGWVSPDLLGFWQKTRLYFKDGVSANQIQDLDGVYIDQVLLRFYKLRTSGMISPKRVFQVQPVSPVEAEIESFAANLAPIWEPAIAPSVAPAQAPESLVKPRFTKPTRGVVTLLMKSIWNLIGVAK